jgi:hypothetical protein
MGRPPYWNKNTNDLNYTTSVIQKLTHLVQGRLMRGFVNFPGRKSKLYFASICRWSAPGNPRPGETLGGDKDIASPTL